MEKQETFVLLPQSLMSRVDNLIPHAIDTKEFAKREFIENWDKEKRISGSKLRVKWDENELIVMRKTCNRPGLIIRMTKKEGDHRLSICIESEQGNWMRTGRMWWTTNGAGSEMFRLVSNYLKIIQR